MIGAPVLLAALAACDPFWPGEILHWSSGATVAHEHLLDEHFLIVRRFAAGYPEATGAVDVFRQDGSCWFTLQREGDLAAFAKAGVSLIEDRDGDGLPEVVVASYRREGAYERRMLIEAFGSKDRSVLWSTERVSSFDQEGDFVNALRGTRDHDGDGTRDLVVVWSSYGPRIADGLQVLCGATGAVLRSIDLQVPVHSGDDVQEVGQGDFLLGLDGAIGQCGFDGAVRFSRPNRMRSTQTWKWRLAPRDANGRLRFVQSNVPGSAPSYAWLACEDSSEPLYEFEYEPDLGVGQGLLAWPDLDGDGLPEVVLTSCEGVHLQLSSGPFKRLLGEAPYGLAEVWDVDEDGRGEVAALVDRDWNEDNNLEPGQMRLLLFDVETGAVQQVLEL